MIVLGFITSGGADPVILWGAVGVMAVSFAVSFISKMKSTMLQTEGGYDTAAF